MKQIFQRLFLFVACVWVSCDSDEIMSDEYDAFPTRNAFWTIHHCEFGLFNEVGMVKIGIFGDTVIQGKTYHKLYGQFKSKEDNHCSDCDFSFDLEQAFYFTSFREEDKKIYVVPHVPLDSDPSGSEYIIFDFNIENAGDEVSVHPFFFSPFSPTGESPAQWGGIAGPKKTYRVKSITRITMSDSSIRLVYTFEDQIVETWIEGIGSTRGFGVFNHLYDITDVTVAFSAGGMTFQDIPLKVPSSGNCGDVNPYTPEYTLPY